MDALQAIVLGIVQGATELLPISSTGHLRIVPAFLGWEDPGSAFTAVTQLGTMAAILLYFRKDLWDISRSWVGALRDPSLRGTIETRLGWFIVVGTIPVSVFGLAFSDVIDDEARSLYVIGTTLVVLGLVLLAAERRGKRTRQLEDLTMRDGVIIGFAQALALIPGVSRSGATMTAGLFLDLDRPTAARYSFLLSIPAVVLSGLFELRKIGDGDGAGLGPTLIATILAFVVGYLTIDFLLKWISNHSFGIFVAYRVVVGVLVLALVSTGVIA